MQKLSSAQRRVMSWVGKGWHGHVGAGSAVLVNGKRICNIDTMMSLMRAGLVTKDDQGCWSATDLGKKLVQDLGL